MNSTANTTFSAMVFGVHLAQQCPFLIKESANLLNEELRQIPDTNGHYEVSNLSRVKSVDNKLWKE
jgi:NUMOD4 motif